MLNLSFYFFLQILNYPETLDDRMETKDQSLAESVQHFRVKIKTNRTIRPFSGMMNGWLSLVVISVASNNPWEFKLSHLEQINRQIFNYVMLNSL